MTPDECRRINDARLAQWGAESATQHSTPLVLVSVGHDHRSGELLVHTLQTMEDAKLLGLLESATAILRRTLDAQAKGGGLN